MIFVDTSAFFAILDRDDDAHAIARQNWTALLSADAPASLATSSYVLVESSALIQARLGLDAVRALHDAILPVVAVHWVLEQDHAAAVSAFGGRPQAPEPGRLLHFRIMRRLGIRQALAYDQHFTEHGFEVIGG